MGVIARIYNFVAGQPAIADQVDAELDAIIAQLNTGVVHKDGSVAMTGQLTLAADPAAALQPATKQYVDGLMTSPAAPGMVMLYGGAAAPTGWLLCQGQAISRTTYANLFAAIGTTFGAGDGSTTFAVPNLLIRFALGASDWAGSTPGTVGGAAIHNHTTSTSALNLGVAAGGTSTAASSTHTHTANSSSSYPPFVAIHYIIRT